MNTKLIMSTEMSMYAQHTLGLLAGHVCILSMVMAKVKETAIHGLKHYTPWRYKWHGHIAPQILNLDTRGR
jgi:hypothetical protein